MPASRTPATTPRPRTAATRAATSRAASATRPRAPLSAQEAQALRELLARRALAQQTRLPRAGQPRDGQARRPTAAARRPATGARPTTRRRPTAAARRPTTNRRPAPGRRRSPRTRRPLLPAGVGWRTRLGVVAFGGVLLPALVCLALSGPQPAPPGGTGGTSLAMAAQTTLLQHAGRYRQLEQQVSSRRAELTHAVQARDAARTEAAAEQQRVGAAAASLYRATPAGRVPMLDLSVTDPARTADVLFRQALADRADQALEGAVVRAARADAAVTEANQRIAEARAALASATEQAGAELAATRDDAAGLSSQVTLQLAGLATSRAPGPEQQRDDRAVQRWQAYLSALAQAGIQPPRAADLTDPANLPAGMSPALDAQHQPIPGVAWAVIGNQPVTVLPAETVAAVSAALAQLGKPYVPGASGPDSFDCGGFAASSWLLAGYALPGTPQNQWTGGAAVPTADLQVGDLVFTDGGLDVGIYLGDGDVLGASAATYRVGVRSLAPGASAVRVTLAAPARPNAGLTPAPGMGACGAPLPAPGPVSPAWGGYSNGRIPASALCPLGVAGHALRCDAAAAYRAMSAAFQAAFGSPLCITDSYRSYAAQVDAFRRKPALAAIPGTSNHGWGLAVDLCGGVNVAGTPQWTWMNDNAARFGFVNPTWARPGAEKPEPWHWEFGNIS